MGYYKWACLKRSVCTQKQEMTSWKTFKTRTRFLLDCNQRKRETMRFKTSPYYVLLNCTARSDYKEVLKRTNNFQAQRVINFSKTRYNSSSSSDKRSDAARLDFVLPGN
uniref:Uncharacterized protein n=1 Tax=Ciona intestinalis TaxID=7719 RepID=F6WXI1_CIOIN